MGKKNSTETIAAQSEMTAEVVNVESDRKKKKKTKKRKMAVGDSSPDIEQILPLSEKITDNTTDIPVKKKSKRMQNNETYVQDKNDSKSKKQTKSKTKPESDPSKVKHVNMQDMLLNKLKSFQNRQNLSSVTNTDDIKGTPEKNEGHQHSDSKIVKNEDAKDYNTKEASDVEDPEKAEIRKKKREKRKLKKQEKERRKREQAEKAGTAKTIAVEYLDLWKNKREEWKFSKVRQCWLLQHMYDESQVGVWKIKH